MLDYSDSDSSDEDDMSRPADSSLMAVADSLHKPQKRRRTMQCRGLIGKQEVLVLVDSGSVSSFVREVVVQQEQLTATSIPQEQFTVADGRSVQCTGIVKDLQWWTQGDSFTQHMRVLALGSFDFILGADWLKDHSPMWVHWQQKKMRFTHNGKRILLKGFRPDALDCRPVSCRKLQGLLRRKSVTHVVQLQWTPHSNDSSHHIAAVTGSNLEVLPSEIQDVLNQFPQVFHETTELPPQRHCDHTIELIPGA